jgi:DNA-binding NtrC family response regulator
VDVRVIAATNADLRKKVEDGAFREDLYFRLLVLDIQLPPLRDRQGDIPLLVRHFLDKFSKKLGKNITGISDQALETVERYPWPGNVRELEHVMERACVLSAGPTISIDSIRLDIAPEAKWTAAPYPDSTGVMPASAEDARKEPSHTEHLVKALMRAGGNKAKAARMLGIDRSTLYRKIHELRIDLSFLRE